MSRPPIRVGIVGAGYWGSNLIRACAELGMLEGICEIDGATAASARLEYPGVEVVSHLEVLLARPIDGVIIAAPACLHAAMCHAAIGAGKHVFVEKPFALNAEEGERIAKAAAKANLIVFVGHQLIYHPAITKLRALIDEGSIGRVWHLRSRRLNLGKLRNHESVWWSFAPHDVSVMLAIMGETPHAVTAAQSTLSDGLPSDVAYADFTFTRGRTAHIETCWLDPERSARLDVFGDEGVITFNDARGAGSLVLKRFAIGTDQRGMPSVSRLEEAQVDFDSAEPLKVELKAFVDSVQTGKQPPTSACHGISVLNTLQMADDALAKREHVRALA